MGRYQTKPCAVVAVVVILVAGGCSQTTKAGEPTNTGVLTGYQLNNSQDFAEGRRDRLGHSDFE